jgi:CubicO group peptidase (beta-lactamase class C family)
MSRAARTVGWLALLVSISTAQAAEKPYFPPAEDAGGWRSLLPDGRPPNDAEKAKIRETAGVDWDKLAAAWEHNAAAEGATGLLVIRDGWVVGEWYRGCGPTTTFNIYSSSKAYTSVAFGILLDDMARPTADRARVLTLDTPVLNASWLPEALPLSDPRKEKVTLRNLLNMLSGIGGENLPTDKEPFEIALGRTEGSIFAKLKGEPGAVYNYSNAGVAHLVLIFQRAAGRDLFPFMKERVFDPVGIKTIRWQPIGGNGRLGPFSQGYSGVHTTAREHARFCWPALHKGNWGGRQLVPSSYYDFAWTGTKVKPDYGAQWWVQPRHPDAPKDLVQTAGARNNHGYVLPSKGLVFVRLGDGQKYEKGFEQTLVKRVIAALVK